MTEKQSTPQVFPTAPIESLDYSALIAAVRALEENPPPGASPFRIAILRNITPDPMLPFLKYLCWRAGLKPVIHLADFDVVMPEAMNPDSELYKFAPDMIVLALTLDSIAEPLVRPFASLTPDQVDAAAGKAVQFVETAVETLRAHSKAFILVHSFASPVRPAFGALDSHGAGRHLWTIRNINAQIARVAAKSGNCGIADIDLLAARVGAERFFDSRMWHIGKIPYTRDGWRALAEEYALFIRALRGKNKKCLVLDCDNTLWGGVVGEDGPEKIRIGNTFPGSCFRAFQQEILNLHHRGVILAICSKNNEADVAEVLERHPEMILRAEHFAAMRVNWNDKASNIREIAAELNIGLDSMVFVDDSAMEIDLVRSLLPEVSCVQLPPEASRYADLLAGCGLFDTLVHSDEDRERGRMYREETQRKKLMTTAAGIDDYLRSLEMEVTVARADSYSIPRIGQLLLRTNQFNLTTRRHSEAEVATMAESPDYEVLSLHYSDRFGDMGIIGAAILRYDVDVSEIDSFLISCRALGRKVEDVFLDVCLQSCRERGTKSVVGVYIPTPKNAQTAGFFPKYGFTKDSETEGEVRYIANLDTAAPTAPLELFKFVKTHLQENS